MNHTPVQSAAFLTVISALTNLQFTDTSYSNDTSDSIYCDKYKLQIFLPNVTNPFIRDDSGEDRKEFAVSYYGFDKDDNGTYIDHEFTLLELVHYLNALEWRFNINGHTETNLSDMVLNSSINENINFREFVEPYLDMEVEDQHLFPNELGGQITVTRIK